MASRRAMTVSADPLPPLSAADLLRGRLMHKSLQVLLDQVRGSRQVLPHLALLEAGLFESGAAVIDQIPATFITKVFSQLRVLPLSGDDAALQDLVSRVQTALRRQARQETHQLSPFDPEATVVITEGSHSDFMQAMGEAAPPGRGAGVTA